MYFYSNNLKRVMYRRVSASRGAKEGGFALTLHRDPSGGFERDIFMEEDSDMLKHQM